MKDPATVRNDQTGENRRERLLVIFPDEWLSHSPTVLNLIDSLTDRFEVNVVALDDGIYRNDALRGPCYHFVRIPRSLSRFFLRKSRTLYALVTAAILYKAVKTQKQVNPPDRVIAVDSLGAWLAMRLFEHCHFLSLEVRKDWFFRHVDHHRLASVIIQSEARYRYLFPVDTSCPVFYVQNAPALPSVRVFPEKPFRKRMIFFGNVMASHGLFDCLEAMNTICQTDNGYTMTIKGVIPKSWVRAAIRWRYRHLLERGNIIIDEEYTPQADIVPYLSSFDIGFCLYNFRLLSKSDFNYLSVPSGKLFNFYAAGVPVVGVDILGLASVREYGTGILVDTLSKESLSQAIAHIAGNYSAYHRNCLAAADRFDFRKSIIPFMEYLTGKA